MIKDTTHSLLATILSKLSWMARSPSPKRERNYPTMVISSPAEVAEWNAKVDHIKRERVKNKVLRAYSQGHTQITG